ncbi:MAG: hypothetical protein ACJA06_002195 [Halocynthiibacter sp.]|jgi:hypothetical protein
MKAPFGGVNWRLWLRQVLHEVCAIQALEGKRHFGQCLRHAGHLRRFWGEMACQIARACGAKWSRLSDEALHPLRASLDHCQSAAQTGAAQEKGKSWLHKVLHSGSSQV